MTTAGLVKRERRTTSNRSLNCEEEKSQALTTPSRQLLHEICCKKGEQTGTFGLGHARIECILGGRRNTYLLDPMPRHRPFKTWDEM